MNLHTRLAGPRVVIDQTSSEYPQGLQEIDDPPERLYCIGNTDCLRPGLAIIGARRATPYGQTCARRFARIAAEKGIVIISGGARGCDAEAHRGALEAQGQTVVFLGGGCDRVYPSEHLSLFQNIIKNHGLIASEHPWSKTPRPYMFRLRNRLIAGLAKAVLIVEAGLPSGTFTTADAALSSNRDVLVVPGAITSETSRGANRLLHQGAWPIVDDETFEDALFSLFETLRCPPLPAIRTSASHKDPHEKNLACSDLLIAAIRAEPMDVESLLVLAKKLYGATEGHSKLMRSLALGEKNKLVVRQPDGLWGPLNSN